MTFVTRRYDSLSMTRVEGRESSLFHASEMASNFISLRITIIHRVRRDGTRVGYVICGWVEGYSVVVDENSHGASNIRRSEGPMG